MNFSGLGRVDQKYPNLGVDPWSFHRKTRLKIPMNYPRKSRNHPIWIHEISIFGRQKNRRTPTAPTTISLSSASGTPDVSGPSGPSGLSEAETGSTGDGNSDEADSWQELVTGGGGWYQAYNLWCWLVNGRSSGSNRSRYGTVPYFWPYELWVDSLKFRPYIW